MSLATPTETSKTTTNGHKTVTNKKGRRDRASPNHQGASTYHSMPLNDWGVTPLIYSLNKIFSDTNF
jgi:hypothetical protein